MKENSLSATNDPAFETGGDMAEEATMASLATASNTNTFSTTVDHGEQLELLAAKLNEPVGRLAAQSEALPPSAQQHYLAPSYE